jgi:hypothetical protein
VAQSSSDSDEVSSGDEVDASRKTPNKRKSTNPRRLLGDVSNTSTPKRSCSANDEIGGVLSETNKLLSAVIKRMDRQEKKMELIENKLNSSVSSSSSTPVRNRQKEVPLQVRVSFYIKDLKLIPKDCCIAARDSKGVCYS